MNGVLCVDSREVAEILLIEHKEFFRRIKGGKEVKGYIELINEKYLLTSKYFIPSTYQDEDGKTKKSFLITRLGCEFLAYEYVGNVAVAFTANYIKNFNKIKPECKKIQAVEVEKIKRLLYDNKAEGEGNLENYYKLRGKLAHKIVNKARGEKDPKEFGQSGKEYTAA